MLDDSLDTLLSSRRVIERCWPLAAEFRFKTFNGNVYTDYELTQMPPKEPQQDRRNGRFVFRSDRFTNARVGVGGPEIMIDTLNGDIRVLQRHATL